MSLHDPAFRLWETLFHVEGPMQFRHVKRRDFLTLLGGAAAWPVAARAQQPAMPVIGFLSSASAQAYAPFVSAYRKGLNEAGLVEGRNVAIEFRWAEGQYDRLPSLASELVGLPVSLISASGGLPAIAAAKAATATVPIVFTLGSDPVKFGIVDSLNRPGGNITGVSLLAYLLDAKRVELLHELVPSAAVLAILVNPKSTQAEAQLNDFQAAARSLGVTEMVLRASTEHEIDTAYATLAQQRGSALVVSADPFFLSRRDQIVAAAAHYRLPSIYEWHEIAHAGGLMSYGVSLPDAYRQAGAYAARILKGEKPSDLPVLQPTKFELVINLRTAKALGLSVSPKLLALSDEVIE
jgi:putative ABC transport system substrate-binding protein